MNEGKNVLIIDDNANLGKTMDVILRRAGSTVTLTTNGNDALKFVKEQTFDLIFIDIKMPDMNGVDTYKMIKQICPDSKVIIITAYADEELISEALEEGAYGVMYKPLDIRKLIECINQIDNKFKGSVLIVDDEPAICRVLKRILEKQGFKVETAISGIDAIEIAEKGNFNIFFIDLIMPGMNGLEILMKLNETFPDSYKIMMTGYRNEFMDLIDETVKQGAFTCIYKPFEITDIFLLLKEISGESK